jgi:hypothetical protein
MDIEMILRFIQGVRHLPRDAGHHTNKAIFPLSSIAFWRWRAEHSASRFSPF